MVLSPPAVPVSLALGINSLYKQSVLEWGTMKLPCMACMCSPDCVVLQWYCSIVVAGALGKKCGILVNTHSFRRQNIVIGSHILLFGGHRKAQEKSAKPGKKDTNSESDTGLKEALRRGSALNWADNRVQPITDRQLLE